MTPRDDESIDDVLARFEREVHAAVSDHEAQLVRDRYLGRKQSVVADWMQRLASAPPIENANSGNSPTR